MISLYAFVRAFVRIALGLFYRKISIEGLHNVPKDKPVLVVVNHQNALIDPLLVGSFFPRSLHYLARSDVFTRWSIPFLKKLHMIPIYRIRDGYSKLAMNDLVFEQCRELFKKNGAVLIFPEGNHGKEYYLRALTKGAARLAFQSQEEIDQDLLILPVGLNFWSHRRPRSKVLIRFGEPFSVKPFMHSYLDGQTKGLISLRDAMADAMKKTLVLPENTPDYEVMKTKIFSLRTEHLSFQELLDLRKDFENLEVLPEKKPLFAAYLLNPVPFLVLQRLLGRVHDIVFHTTIKFCFAIIVFPLWWGLTFTLLAIFFGWKIGLLAAGVMIGSLFFSYQAR